MSKVKMVVRHFEYQNKWIRLNKLMDGKTYNYRTKKYQNPVKAKGDSACIRAIMGQLKGVRITSPCVIKYHFYAPDKWDADGVISAFWKCYLDALQKCNVIKNDTYDYIGAPRLVGYDIDRKDPRVEIEIIELEREE